MNTGKDSDQEMLVSIWIRVVECILRESSSSHTNPVQDRWHVYHPWHVKLHKPLVRLAYFFCQTSARSSSQNEDKKVAKDKSLFSILSVYHPQVDVYIYLYLSSLRSISPLSVVSHCLDWSIFNFLSETMRGVGLWLLVGLSLPLLLYSLFFLYPFISLSFSPHRSLLSLIDCCIRSWPPYPWQW